MSSIHILVRLNENDSIAEIISAHPTHQVAINAERFYRSYDGKHIDGLRTDIREIDFNVN